MIFRRQGQILFAAIIPLLGIMCLVLAIYLSTFSKAFAQKTLDQILVDEGNATAGAPTQILPENGSPEIRDNKSEPAFDGEKPYEDIVLAVSADREILSAGVFAIMKDGKFYLPIQSLSEILGFNTQIDLNRKVAEGWSVDTDQRFVVNVAEGQLKYPDGSSKLDLASVIDEPGVTDDMYVQLEVLNKIWPVLFEVDFAGLVLKVNPTEKLAFQELMERQKRRENLEKRREYQDDLEEEEEEYPFVAYPYQVFGMPSIDVSASLGYEGSTNGARSEITLGGVQDLAYSSADYSITTSKVNGEVKKPENFRLRFRRQNIHDRALPFGLEDVQWGDVRLDYRDLISGGISGRGATFSTRKYYYDNEFDLITIDGIGTPGWETELYINEQLIDFGVVDERGEYRFEDVSITFGNNRIRVMLYGPQGQIKERNENYFYQSSMVQAGTNEFSGGVMEANRDLIPIEERDSIEAKGLTANIYGARGINDKLTAFASLTSIKDLVGSGIGREEVSRHYATAGVVGLYKNTLAQAEVYKEIGGGQAFDVRTLSEFKGVNINARGTLYSNFESPYAESDTQAKEREFDIKVRRNFATSFGSIGLDAGLDYLKKRDDSTLKNFTTRQSIGINGTRVSHNTRTAMSNGTHTATTARLASSTRFNRWTWRNGANFEYYPQRRISSFDSELRISRSRDYSTAFRVQRNFDENETVAGVQLTKDFQKFLGSVEADWSTVHGASLMLRASTSFGPYGMDGDYILDSDPLRNAGPVGSFVYLDRDYDGLYGEGDEPVADTKMRIGRRITQGETDENGYLVEVSNATNTRLNVAVDKKSIDDPYVIPAIAGYNIYPRPGVIHSLEFPLIETGALDGTIAFLDGSPVAGLDLQLMNRQGDIVQNTTTAPDGYYTFERVPPGSYTIRANPETGLSIPFKYVDITPDNMFQFGVDVAVADLKTPQGTDLGIGVDPDGKLSVKNILSLIRGLKDKGRTSTILKTAEASSFYKEDTKIQTKAIPASAPPPAKGQSVVSDIRLGSHPGKLRVVLDLSSPTAFEVKHDKEANMVMVELPQAGWSAKQNWQDSKGKIVRQYQAEPLGSTGTVLKLSVDNNAKVGSSGLLKPYAGKKDRLYIDIEQK